MGALYGTEIMAKAFQKLMPYWWSFVLTGLVALEVALELGIYFETSTTTTLTWIGAGITSFGLGLRK